MKFRWIVEKGIVASWKEENVVDYLWIYIAGALLFSIIIVIKQDDFEEKNKAGYCYRKLKIWLRRRKRRRKKKN